MNYSVVVDKKEFSFLISGKNKTIKVSVIPKKIEIKVS